MARGIAGYGRYEDSPQHVGCPWSRSSETPCLARDGRLALTGGFISVCAGCGNSVTRLTGDLADDYPPAGEAMARDKNGPYVIADDLDAAADKFRDLVFQATAPLVKGEDSDRPEPPPG